VEKYEAKSSVFMPTKREDVLDLVEKLQEYKEEEQQIQ
jgi:uncharacterized protein Yka (UPF0111/DUF47 family)